MRPERGYRVALSERELAAERTAVLKKWTNRARELEAQEKHPAVASILAPNRLILAEFNYPDMGVFDEIIAGTALTGETVRTACHGYSGGNQETACKLRKKTLTRYIPGSEVGNVVATKTAEKCTKGWLVGPISFDDLCGGVLPFGASESVTAF